MHLKVPLPLTKAYLTCLNAYFISTQVLQATEAQKDLEDREDQQGGLGVSRVVRCTHAGGKSHVLRQQKQPNCIQVKKMEKYSRKYSIQNGHIISSLES